ncbi:MAG: hypothetical protein PHC28_13695 [Flavobacterium sp.]|uniref:hypothetical protein n=1 Tax=Flavobacterium sp. TaxID=239 RepID=UPI00261EA80C|nr:hypothetical protein [Flavobacterium sp.]MDD5151506.1 hypothetical protein [Flavobacterium sp.]
MTKQTAKQVEMEGGKWLGTTREYLLNYVNNSNNLRWGSDDIIVGLTVKQLEHIVALAIATDRNTIK